jgi:pyruvate dehydrogenase E2 component (dihydrolipoamide acetyltransferase)
MAVEVVMPRLSDTMEEGRIIKWLKSVGDEVKEGEPLLEVETDKADIEVESFDTGTLIEIIAEEGETVKVGQKIAMIGAAEEAEAPKPTSEAPEEAVEPSEAGEAKPAEKEQVEETAAKEKKEKKEEEQKEKKQEEIDQEEEPREPSKEKPTPPPPAKKEPARKEPEVTVHMEKREAIDRFVARRAPEKKAASPLAKELARTHGVDLSTIEGTGPGGEIVKHDIERAVAGKEAAKKPKAEVAEPPEKRKPHATPMAIILAEKEGIDLDEIAGTGINGRIRELDVKAYVAKRCAMRGEEYKELSLMRKTIARRMTESVQTTPHFYLTMPIDMGAALAHRKRLNEGRQDTEKISLNDIVVKAVALALEQVPEVNATFSDDKIRVNKQVNIGIATATPDGLVVPVIFDANTKSVGDIAAEARDKIARAKKRKLKPDEYSNATFTVSNLGMFGIEHFTAIIDPGQSGILAVGAVVKEPYVKNDSFAMRQTMRVTLSCDHRVVDGYTGTQYLIQFKSILEAPEETIQ